jgi:molybdate transport system substrate-binding protein
VTARLRDPAIVVVIVATVLLIVRGEAGAQTTPLRVFASNNVQRVMETLQRDAEQAIGRPITVQIGTSATLKQRIADGEEFDVAVLIPEMITALNAVGKTAPESIVELVRSDIGLAIPATAKATDVQSEEGLKRALLSARSIAYLKDGASRVPIDRMLDALGVSKTIAAKVLLIPEAEIPDSIVKRGADLVILRTNQLELVQGGQAVLTLPAAWRGYVHLQAAISAKSPNVAASQSLIHFLTAPKSAVLFKANDQEKR